MQNNTIPNNTIPKNILLNWLYSTDRHVSIDKLGVWLQDNTNGKYKLVKIGDDIQTHTNSTMPLHKEYA